MGSGNIAIKKDIKCIYSCSNVSEELKKKC